MKKITSLFSVLLIACLFATVFACAEDNNVNSATSSTGATSSVGGAIISNADSSLRLTAVSPDQVKCTAGREMSKELSILIKDLEKAEKKEDTELTNALHEKIKNLKKRINKDMTECRNTISEGNTEIPVAISESASSGGSSGGHPTRVTQTVEVVAKSVKIVDYDPCKDLEKLKQKYQHYLDLSNLDDKSLKEKGYENKERINEILKTLKDDYIKRTEAECNKQKTSSPDLEISNTIEVIIAPETGDEIATYYKEKITDIMASESDTKTQIKQLKDIRKEIDGLIKDLIQSQEEVNSEEMSELVEKIEIKKGEISADDVKVDTVNKAITKIIRDKEIKIKPTQNNVIIEDKVNGEKIEVETEGVTIEEGELKIGDSIVGVAAGEVIETLGIDASNIELKEENKKAIYEMKSEKKGKLLGIISIKYKERVKVNAENADNIEVMDTKGPALGFLVSKEKVNKKTEASIETK